MKGKEAAEPTVLVIDDEREMRFILKSILKDIGVKNIIEAEDAKNALHVVKYSFRPIDLVLCDWNLPGMTGLELLEKLQTTGFENPFFIVSGRGDHDSVLQAKNAGVTGYIRKPFSPAQVESRICTALQRSKDVESL